MVKKALFFLILFALSVLFMLTKPTLHIWSYDKIQNADSFDFGSS